MSKSLTSAAIFDLKSVASKRVIGPAPDLPAMSADQNSSTPVPIGVTGPMPVTAMRRLPDDSSGTGGNLPPQQVDGLTHGRDVLELGVGDLDLEALLDG